mmetsp:Transcript_81750/g.212673  ORF Transcript_81750/g.212673 Transcript_81750/m.212673 type:complete len:244 (+) Transcript_81750:559-1290(+)
MSELPGSRSELVICASTSAKSVLPPVLNLLLLRETCCWQPTALVSDNMCCSKSHTALYTSWTEMGRTPQAKEMIPSQKSSFAIISSSSTFRPIMRFMSPVLQSKTPARSKTRSSLGINSSAAAFSARLYLSMCNFSNCRWHSSCKSFLWMSFSCFVSSRRTWFFSNMLSEMTPVSNASIPKLPQMTKKTRKHITTGFSWRTPLFRYSLKSGTAISSKRLNIQVGIEPKRSCKSWSCGALLLAV